MSHPVTPQQARDEARTARFLFLFAALVLVIGAVSFAIWGLPALSMIGLAATALVFLMLAAYAAGL